MKIASSAGTQGKAEKKTEKDRRQNHAQGRKTEIEVMGSKIEREF